MGWAWASVPPAAAVRAAASVRGAIRAWRSSQGRRTARHRTYVESEIAALERCARRRADQGEVGDRPQPQHRARALGAAERAELDREPGEADGVGGQLGEGRLVERLEGQPP